MIKLRRHEFLHLVLCGFEQRLLFELCNVVFYGISVFACNTSRRGNLRVIFRHNTLQRLDGCMAVREFAVVIVNDGSECVNAALRVGRGFVGLLFKLQTVLFDGDAVLLCLCELLFARAPKIHGRRHGYHSRRHRCIRVRYECAVECYLCRARLHDIPRHVVVHERQGEPEPFDKSHNGLCGSHCGVESLLCGSGQCSLYGLRLDGRCVSHDNSRHHNNLLGV